MRCKGISTRCELGHCRVTNYLGTPCRSLDSNYAKPVGHDLVGTSLRPVDLDVPTGLTWDANNAEDQKYRGRGLMQLPANSVAL
jgi:hypothetical protein